MKTAVIQRSPQLLKEVDADVAAELTAGMEALGITIYRNTALVRTERSGAEKVIHFCQDGKDLSVKSEEIVYALGRTPNVRGLGLEAAGVELKRGAIMASATQQTSQPHIFAAGDVCGPYEVVHIAIQQGEIAANAECLLAGTPAEKLDRIVSRLKLFAVFAEPQVAAVGLTEREAADAGIPFIEAKYPFTDHGKSLVMGAKHGFVKLIVHKDTREILGGAVVGPQASELSTRCRRDEVPGNGRAACDHAALSPDSLRDLDVSSRGPRGGRALIPILSGAVFPRLW